MEMKFRPEPNAFGKKTGAPSVKPSPLIMSVALLVGKFAPATPMVKLLCPARKLVGSELQEKALALAVGARTCVIRNVGLTLVTVKLTVLVFPATSVTGVLGVGRKAVSEPRYRELMSPPRQKNAAAFASSSGATRS